MSRVVLREFVLASLEFVFESNAVVELKPVIV